MTKAVQEISRGTRPACSKCLQAALELLVKQKRMAKTQAVPTPFAQAGPLPEFLTGDEDRENASDEIRNSSTRLSNNPDWNGSSRPATLGDRCTAPVPFLLTRLER
jgi:hypothetical protein